MVTVVQMAGALTVAAGVPAFFASGSLLVVVVGHVVIRLAMVSQWLRAARDDPERRATALTYAVGVVVVQALWIVSLALPHAAAVPAIAERRTGAT